MEIDARTIREVEFREKIRGYNPDDVDDFLEQVALAFEAMEDRFRNSPAVPPAPSSPQIETKDVLRSSSIISTPIDRSRGAVAFSEFDDDTIQRTLLLAQKTADTTVKRAEEQAQATLEEAKSRAEVMISQAQQRAREIVDDAVNQARDDVLDLAKSKDKLLAELNQLNSRVSAAKGQMKELLESVLNQIDESFAPYVARDAVRTNNEPVSASSDSEISSVSNVRDNLFSEGQNSNGSGVFDDEIE